MEFKDVFKELRTKHHLSQGKLAEALGTSASLIGLYENGVRKPSRATLEAIADYFNVSIDYLTGREERSTYYIDPEAAEIAQDIFNNRELRLLFDAARDASAEDLKATHDILLALKKRERGE